MKKFFSFISLFVFFFILSFTITSCDLSFMNNVTSNEKTDSEVDSNVSNDEPNIQPAHEHTYSAEWTFDNNYHWHNSTCEHTSEVSGKALHEYDECIL